MLKYRGKVTENMPNKAITVLIGIGGAFLIAAGLNSLVFADADLEGASGYFGAGYMLAIFVFLGGGGALLWLFFRRTRKAKTSDQLKT